MRFRKIYVEISNRCNLSCRFCPGTKRTPGRMEIERFSALLPKLRPYTDYLYFHVMGEPLCHPQLEQFLTLAGQAGFKVILTTNGTLLAKQREMLLGNPGLYKVNISLHAFEANDLAVPFEQYLDDCFAFGRAAAGSKLVVYRLWNQGGADALNTDIIARMKTHFTDPWVVEQKGTRVDQRVYLEYGEKFDWPDMDAPEGSGQFACRGLNDQIGVLWDGTVIPCCLDHEGDLALGNLFESDLEEILSAPRARAICDGFARGEAVEPLCRRCGYARRFE